MYDHRQNLHIILCTTIDKIYISSYVRSQTICAYHLLYDYRQFVRIILCTIIYKLCVSSNVRSQTFCAYHLMYDHIQLLAYHLMYDHRQLLAYHQMYNFNPFLYTDDFRCLCRRGRLKTLWQKMKLLIIRKFYFYQKCFHFFSIIKLSI